MCRLRQDEAGRSYIDGSNSGFIFSTVEDRSLELLDVLRDFAYSPAPEVEPTQRLAEGFVEQLDSVGYLKGESPLFGVRLTNVKNGSILGVSMSHAVSGLGLTMKLAYRLQTLRAPIGLCRLRFYGHRCLSCTCCRRITDDMVSESVRMLQRSSSALCHFNFSISVNLGHILFANVSCSIRIL